MGLHMKNNFIVLFLVSVCVFTSFDLALSESNTDELFMGRISMLMKDNAIPKRKGTIISLGDFDDYCTTYGNIQITPLLETQHFVFFSNLTWASTTEKTDVLKSGCGIVMHYMPETKESVVISLRMDGNIYFDGMKNYRSFNLGSYYFRKQALEHTVELLVVVDGERAIVYIDGNRIVTKANLPVTGSYFGLCSISGAYQPDYGTRCTFNDMFIYTW